MGDHKSSQNCALWPVPKGASKAVPSKASEQLRLTTGSIRLLEQLGNLAVRDAGKF